MGSCTMCPAMGQSLCESRRPSRTDAARYVKALGRGHLGRRPPITRTSSAQFLYHLLEHTALFVMLMKKCDPEKIPGMRGWLVKRGAHAQDRERCFRTASEASRGGRIEPSSDVELTVLCVQACGTGQTTSTRTHNGVLRRPLRQRRWAPVPLRSARRPPAGRFWLLEALAKIYLSMRELRTIAEELKTLDHSRKEDKLRAAQLRRRRVRRLPRRGLLKPSYMCPICVVSTRVWCVRDVCQWPRRLRDSEPHASAGDGQDRHDKVPHGCTPRPPAPSAPRSPQPPLRLRRRPAPRLRACAGHRAPARVRRSHLPCTLGPKVKAARGSCSPPAWRGYSGQSAPSLTLSFATATTSSRQVVRSSAEDSKSCQIFHHPPLARRAFWWLLSVKARFLSRGLNASRRRPPR